MEELILRSLQGRTTPAEEERLLAWRAKTDANEREYQELAGLWTLSGTLPRSPAGPTPTIERLIQTASSRPASPLRQSWLSRALGEFKRRRVVRVAAAYAVAVWLVIQVASDSAPALGAPEWAVSMIVLLGVLGFPVAVALAWAFDVTSSGIVRTRPPREALHLIPSYTGRIAVAGAVVILALAGGAFLSVGRTGDGGPLGDEESRTVAVLPFTVRASEPLEYLSDGMVEVLSSELEGSDSHLTVDANRVLQEVGGGPGVYDPTHGRHVAAVLGAASYVVGSVLEAGGQVRLTASVYDRSRGSHPVLTRSLEGALAELIPLASQLARELAAGLADLRRGAAVGVNLVWSGDDAGPLGSVSTDGKRLSFTAWADGGNLAVRELDSGSNTLLTHKGDLSIDDEFAEFSRFSPDASQLAYAWFTSEYRYELRVIRPGDSTAQIAVGGHGWLAPAAWKSDGSAILAFVADGRDTNQLVWASPDGAVVDTAAADVSPDVSFWGLSLSPDDRWIAHALVVRDSTQHTDIALMTANGEAAGTLVSGPANEGPLGWLPDGRGLLFWSDRGGVPSLWLLPVENGRPQGAPRLVRADVAWPVGLGFAGRDFYYGVTVSDRQVYHAAMGAEGDGLLEPPTPAAHGSAGSTTAPAWSPDGARLAYVTEGLRFGLNAASVGVREVATGAVREYPLDLAFPRGLTWLPDGSGLVFMARPRAGTGRLHHLDFASGRVERVAVGSDDGFKGQFDLSPDGRTVYLVEADSDGRVKLLRHERESGHETTLARNVMGGSIIRNQPVAVSPDGERLAFAVPDRDGARNDLYVLPSAGGPMRLVHQTPLDENFSSVRWTADGENLLFVINDRLWRLRLADGHAVPVLQMRGLNALSVHPDGRRVAFSAGERKGEIWRLEDPGSVLGRR